MSHCDNAMILVFHITQEEFRSCHSCCLDVLYNSYLIVVAVADHVQ